MGLEPRRLITGSVRDKLMREGASLSGKEIDRLFLHGADGRFADASLVSGLDSVYDGRGFAWLDVDRDGRLDIAKVNANAPLLQVFVNRMEPAGNFVAVRLRGTTANRDGVGARVTVEAGDRSLIRERRAGEGFAAQNSATMLVGIGDATSARVRVRWPGGDTSEVDVVAAGEIVEIVQGGAATRSRYAPSR